MQKIRIIFLGLIILTSIQCFAQQSEVIASYIYNYKQLAIDEMKRSGVPAAITLAQGIHESGAGKSVLALKSNNHFGIKCKTNWAGEKVYHYDDARGECFRKYEEVEQSYKDHSDFLRNGQRYAFLFELDPEDYAGWAHGLKKAGYATNPKYPQVLIRLIEDYGLQHYTLLGVGKIPDVHNPDEVLMGQPPDSDSKNDEVVIKQEEKPVEAVALTPAYPKEQFSINDTKVIFVIEGTAFFAIASAHNVNLAKLFEFNDMQPTEVASRDMLVYLQRKRKTGNEEFHKVQPGETLHDIAQKQAIRLESLQQLNGLKGDNMPAPGEMLSLKDKSNSTPKLASKTNNSLTSNKN